MYFVGRVKKREKDREELWQKLDDLHVSAAKTTATVAVATTMNSKPPET